ncbi:MAG: disulfide bond formation protein B [Emcibacter sp.]|nr:disulfide bond formation protein B [Emcibacter sp.]
MTISKNPFMRLICFFWCNPLYLAALMSLSLLLGAYGFQYIGGYEPCALCWSQRYAHLAILLLSLMAIALKKAPNPFRIIFTAATVIALYVSVVAAGYHGGVEQKWWKGPNTCTSSGIDQNADMESLFDNMMNKKILMCDEIPWQIFGISIAGFNFLISLAVALFVSGAVISTIRKNHD